MARDPLAVLSRIRGAAVAEARRALAAALAAEHRCASAAQAARDTVRDEEQAATASDTLALIAWLPLARQRIAEADQTLKAATLEVGRWRTELTARRAAEEAVSTLLKQRATEMALLAARREQAVLDEAAARSRRQSG